MPRADNAAPRNMLPPPTTTATCTPSRDASLISRAKCDTASGSIPSPAPPANASPDSLRTTRCQAGRSSICSPAELCPAAAWVPPATPSPDGVLSGNAGSSHLSGRRAPIQLACPIWNRAKPRTVAPVSASSCFTDLLGSRTDGCSTSATSLKNAFSRPSTIFPIACSGLPSSRVTCSAIRRSLATTSSGTSSLVTYCGRIAATWCAISIATGAPASSMSTSTPSVGRRAASSLSDVFSPLDAQRLYGSLEVAVGLDEGVLAVHHARASQIAEPLDVCGTVVRHVLLSRSLVNCPRCAPPHPVRCSRCPC